MATTELDFLPGEPTLPPEASPPPAAAPEAAAPAAAAAPEAAAPAADAAGEQAPAAPASAAPAEGAAPAQAGHTVPLPTFLDLRDRATAAENEARQLRAWRAQQEAAARRQPPPDPVADPVAYEQHREEAFQDALFGERVRNSFGLAELRHGAEVAQRAYRWGLQRCDQDPFFNQKVRASLDPGGLVVAEFKREQMLARLDPNDLDAFQAWKAAQQPGAQPGAQPQPSAAAPAPAAPLSPVAPRPSLASGPSAGSAGELEAMDGEQAFGKMFGG